MKKKLHLLTWQLAGVCLVVCLSVWTLGCGRSVNKIDSDAASVQVGKPTVAVGVVRAQLLEKTMTLPATVESDEQAMLMAKVEAYVKHVLVDIGDEVVEGQVLVRLDAPELLHQTEQQQRMMGQMQADEQVLQAELAAARSQLESLQAKLALKNSERDRLMRLVSSGAINRQRLEEAEYEMQSAAATLAQYENAVRVAEARLQKGAAEMLVAQSQLETAQAMAAYLEIKSPFAGVVATRSVDPGALVLPVTGSKPLLTIAKVDRVRVIFYATMDVTANLAVGNVVKFEADDVPGRQFEAVVSRLAGTYDEKTRMMRAEVDLLNAPDPTSEKRPLRAGSYGSATITLQSATLPVVPQAALLRHAASTSVVVVRDGVCLIVPVQIAIETEELAGIASGLQAGDQVVIENLNDITEGQKLTSGEIKLISF